MPLEIPDPGFAGDDGSPDPRLAAALDDYARGDRSDLLAERAVLEALVSARLLVPVVPVVAVVAAPAAGAVGEGKRTDMALVTIRAPSGRRGLPAFGSLAALRAWNADARPVPTPAPRAAAAALAEGADAVLVDYRPPAAYVLAGPALYALAAGRLPIPPLEDREVVAVVDAALGAEPAFAGFSLRPARDGDLAVVAAPAPGVTAAEAGEAARRVAAVLAADPVLRTRLGRGLEMRILPADNRP